MEQMMTAAVLYEPGSADNFKLEERPIPVPLAGQVLIKVRAFGLNRSELMTRKGLSPDVTFPRILGIECVGEIEEDPNGEWQNGQQVAAFMGNMGRHFDGSYSQFVVLPRAIISPFQSHLSWEMLGALPEMFQTTYGSLHIALKIQKGETLLIRGGTSSIGLLAAQLAKLAGLQVISTTRDETKIGLLLSNGADQVLIDNGNLAEKVNHDLSISIDKVLELVGTNTLKDSLHCVAQGGMVCMTGMLAEQWSVSSFDPMGFIPAAVGLTVYDSGQIRIPTDLFQHFINSMEQKEINPPIKKTFALSDIVAAHVFMESNVGGGKIVVLP